VKVIRLGIVRVPWYVGLRARCGICKTEVEFGTEDRKAVVGLATGEQELRFRCPGCEAVNTITQPANKLWQEGEDRVVQHDAAR
jgi:hypothetical protein